MSGQVTLVEFGLSRFKVWGVMSSPVGSRAMSRQKTHLVHFMELKIDKKKPRSRTVCCDYIITDINNITFFGILEVAIALLAHLKSAYDISFNFTHLIQQISVTVLPYSVMDFSGYIQHQLLLLLAITSIAGCLGTVG